MERIPPTKNTFPQHIWRAVYQADNLYSSTALSGWSKKSTPSNSWNSKNVCAGETVNLNCNCCKPNSPVHVFVIVNAINGDWLTMFAAMILLLCEAPFSYISVRYFAI